MSDSPVVAAAFPTVFDAQVFVNRLEAEDIPAHVIDGEAATTLGYLGAAIGGVKVHVLQRDLERALQVLGELQGAQEWGAVFSDDSEWHCEACEAAVPAEHDVCWSCGAVRAGRPAEAASGFAPVPEEDRTTGEDAMRETSREERVAHPHGPGTRERGSRTMLTLLVLLLTGPFALLYMGCVYLFVDDAGTATRGPGRAVRIRVALLGFALMLAVGAAIASGLFQHVL